MVYKIAYSHKYKYFHVKIASLANVKSSVTVGPIHSCLALYSLSGLPLRLSSLTEDTAPLL